MSNNIRIHALPLHLANQISAGEVIERPASVVKELVENSIDAGATLIDINIEGAGNQLIRVRDNGIGIHPDDLALALSRHATSKLHSSEQLSHISSLGFRGEALPSIASISRLTITSRQANNDYAWQIIGDNVEVLPAAHPQGTTLEIRDLFFNVPARRHFLRSNKTEQHHILTTLHRLALSQFEVGFNCNVSNKLQLKLPIANTKEQQQQRIAKICGRAFINNCHYLTQDYDEISLNGWLANAESHRSQTDIQYFFINGRVIKDRVINHAIRQAYGDLIPAGRQAAYILYLTIPLDRVDINVHPTKHEVRFRDARLIHGLITTALQEALTQDKHAIDLFPESSHHPHIAEKEKTYHSHPLSQQKGDPIQHGTTITTLLHQRYAIILTTEEPQLVDLQQADQYLRQQQFQHALKTNTLRSRPILVPIKLVLDRALVAVINKYTSILETLGMQLIPYSEGIIIKSIPSLLAQVNLTDMLLNIIPVIDKSNGDIRSISNVLQEHIPLIPIQNIEQAQYILEQLNNTTVNTNWSTSLDQQTLISLF